MAFEALPGYAGNGYGLDDSIHQVVYKGLEWRECHAASAEAIILSMPVGVVASTRSLEWEPRDKDLKHYFHFDRFIDAELATRIANDPALVSKHSFFPLIRFYESWTKFREKGAVKKIKVRPLRYAAHLDAVIYARYRSLLAELYEEELRKRELTEVPVAYRRLIDTAGHAKSNIEIARDVFAYVKNIGDCIVTVVDIKSYFQSLDHANILKQWAMLVGEPLPKDHTAVLTAVTKYSVVDYEKVATRLELRERDTSANTRKLRRRRKIDHLRKTGNKQLCSPKQFRELVAGASPTKPSLIQKNGFDFGIPQGTPISDLIANFYLIDFDEDVNRWAMQRGGIYRRYSDDIIIVLPKTSMSASHEAKNYLQDQIQLHGRRLRIQDKKVCICEFSSTLGAIDFRHVYGSSSKNGLEYLGFEYDGRRVKIRNATMSNAWRKMKKQAYGHAFFFVKRYRDKGEIWIRANYPSHQLEKTILQDVTYHQDKGYETWTFVKYARRASRAFVGMNAIFSSQTRRYRYFTRTMIQDGLDTAVKKLGLKCPS